MAHAHSNPDAIADVRFYLQGVAKSVVDRLYGPQGPPWGTTLSSMEKTFDAVRSALTEHMLALALSRHADSCAVAEPEATCCPSCQRPTELRDPEPRDVMTEVGRAAWLEPQRYCTKCRRAFFPSVPSPRP
jgi:hypothetical protein